jgi:hypothetical protein
MRRHVKSLIKLIEDHISDPKHGAEIGVWEGETASVLLGHFPNLTLRCVDLWDELENNPTMPKSKDESKAARVKCSQVLQPFGIRAEMAVMSSVDAAQFFVPGSADFVFIDACHLYESVKQDIEAWHNAVRCGGLVCGHDYAGVGDRCRDWGVKTAVDEWCAKHKLKVGVRPGNVWWFFEPWETVQDNSVRESHK